MAGIFTATYDFPRLTGRPDNDHMKSTQDAPKHRAQTRTRLLIVRSSPFYSSFRAYEIGFDSSLDNRSRPTSAVVTPDQSPQRDQTDTHRTQHETTELRGIWHAHDQSRPHRPAGALPT